MKITKESIYLIFIFLFLIIPFIAIPWKFDGFEYPKYLITVIFGSICGVSLILSKKDKLTMPNREFLIYFALFIISVIFSNNFLYSFFGDYPRLNQNLILYLALFCISLCYLNFLEKINIFELNFYSSLLLGFTTIFEFRDRVYSTIGQPNFLGIILVLGIIYSLEKFKESKYYLIGTLFLVFILIKTASITSIFALIIGICYFFWSEGRKYYKYFLPIMSLIIVFLYLSPLTSTKISDTFNLFFTNHKTKISDSLLVRFYIWEDSINISTSSLKNFLVGIGPENFSLIFESYRGKNINYTSEWASLIDKPHNYFLEILIEQGIIGLISFLYLIYFVLKRNVSDRKYLIPIIIFLFFNWPFIYLQLILFIILVKNKEDSIKLPKISFVIISIFLLIINFITGYKYEEIENNINYFDSKNPEVLLNGLNYHQDKKDLPQYINHLKKEYPNNLKIWFEIYKMEKIKNLPEANITKEKIKLMRSDLIEWNEVFR